MSNGNNTYTEVRREADPAQVRCEEPSTNRVNLPPNVDEIGESRAKGDDIDRSRNGLTNAKVEGSPHQVQGELNSIKSGSVLHRLSLDSSRLRMVCSYLGQSNGVGVSRCHSSSVRAIGCVAHCSVEGCPDWSEDVARGV
jgi:hypothetical protein